ncbi:C45 family autoproteolytic acyltransferase/hydolase [Natronococcus wangiae]|uniref:C45 family autoproteolytic acyltransferase/hydolase n=1 Tax=Natronococcus wangiae TaxID=3068275 RepID=UPI00273D076E|nr:C45 family peptidase [Natronococcus sp. AD5]
MIQIPHITVSGSPYERGLDHGKAFEEEIRNNISTYIDRFAQHGAAEETVRDRAAEFRSRLEEWHPAYEAEVHGIAEGSGLPIEEIVLLNVRYEILYAAYVAESTAAGSDGCTSFGLLPGVTETGHTYLGQNWDWAAPIESTLTVIKTHQEDGPDRIGVTEAGIVGEKMGVNEHGIGLVVNGLVSPDDGTHPFRKPFHVRCREVLEADRFDRALEPFVNSARACSANLVIGCGEGEILDLETAPENVNCLYPQEGIITHANHFESPGFDSRMERQLPDTLYRSRRLRTALEQEHGEIDRSTIETALQDHFGRPASVCRHVDEEESPNERTQTDTSVIIDLVTRTLWATQGPPCKSAYTEYELSNN